MGVSRTGKYVIALLMIAGAVSILAVFLLAGCFVNDMATYYSPEYKPRHLVEARDMKKMRAVGADYEYEEFTLSLEWNRPYDKETRELRFYELILWVKPKTPALESASITDIGISSSLGSEYAFTTGLPLVFNKEDLDKSYGWAHHFEPAFDFRFAEQEIITLRITMEMTVNGQKKQIEFEEVFVPIEISRGGAIV